MKKIEIKKENILIILFSFYNILFKQKQEIIYNIQNCQILKHYLLHIC